MTHGKDQLRRRLAQEAARLMAEEGIHDHFLAKHKAAARLGVPARHLPRNEEIDQALAEHHRLYRAESQPKHIRQLRRLAMEAMQFLRAYAPRLVGGVLEGWAGAHSPVTLYLFPTTREEVLITLAESRIPSKEKAVAVFLNSGRTVQQTAVCFLADGVEIRLILWPEDMGERMTARNQAGADLPGLAALLDEG